MPAVLMPMTKGDDPAPAPPAVSSGEFDGHMSVTKNMGSTEKQTRRTRSALDALGIVFRGSFVSPPHMATISPRKES